MLQNNFIASHQLQPEAKQILISLSYHAGCEIDFTIFLLDRYNLHNKKSAEHFTVALSDSVIYFSCYKDCFCFFITAGSTQHHKNF